MYPASNKSKCVFANWLITTLVILLCCFPLLLSGEDHIPEKQIGLLGFEKIWFIPGWKASDQQVGGYEKLIREIYKTSVLVLEWDSNQSWEKSRDNSKVAAKKLVYRIDLLSQEQQKDLIIIGHSLGARVIANASKELSEKNIKIKRVIFLGAAIDYDAEELKYVSNISIEVPINVFSQDDGVLKYAYGNTENKVACGCFGTTKNNKFEQYSVTMNEQINQKGVIQSLENHYVENYCSVLKRIEEKQELKPVNAVNIDDMFEHIDGLLKETNIYKLPTMYFPTETITVIQENKGWMFANLGKWYAIIDPLGRLISYGTREDTLRAQWKRLYERLNKADQK